jgi:ribosomal protein L37E
MAKCNYCANEAAHEKAKHCKSCNFAFMAGRAEALTKAKSLVREIQLQAWEQERERILCEVEKMRPYIDSNGVNWFAPFNNIIKVIKGEK